MPQIHAACASVTFHSFTPHGTSVAFSFDRDRVRAFGRFVWRRFLDDKCLETAGALSYTTLFALVPLTAAVFGILSALPSFQGLTERVQHFLFNSFVPAAGEAVQHYLMQFAGNASKLTGIGIVVFLLSALAMLSSIEERFNRIWRVTSRRSPVSRFLMYWAALTLGPILVVAGLTLTSYLAAVPFLGQFDTHRDFLRYLWGVLPFVVTLVGLFAMYTLVPNRRVPAKYAAIGALLAALLFGVARWGFAAYVRSVPSYEQIYGQLAVIPIFLLWVYMSWILVLLGASITASLAAFEYQPHAWRLPEGCEFLGLMHLLKHLVRMQHQGRGMTEEAMLHCEQFMTEDLLQRYLRDLGREKLVRLTGEDSWVMVRHLEEVSLAGLYETGHYRLPLDGQACEPLMAHLPASLTTALEVLSARVREGLGASLESVFSVEPDDAGATR